jgi:serine/threonine-protein kinase
MEITPYTDVGTGDAFLVGPPPIPRRVSLHPDELPYEARRLSGRYEILAELGRGGMAIVYLARDRQTGQRVAIKLVASRYAGDREAIQRFAREARTVAGLRHPNLVRTLGVESLEGEAFAIVNAYVHGRTLRAVLREAGPLRFDVVVGVLRDVAAGLAHAHAARIVHRDVKPENIFLEDGTDRALLADFGIARSLDTETLLTQAGSSLGTPTYMAPEQVDGQVADERADVYALGLVGWEMVAGRRPWQGETLYAVLHKQKHERLPDLARLRPDIPAFLLYAIDGALRKAPGDRWRDAGEFLEQLMPRPSALPPVRSSSTEIDATTMRRIVPVTAVEPPAAPPIPPAAPVAPAPAAAPASPPPVAPVAPPLPPPVAPAAAAAAASAPAPAAPRSDWMLDETPTMAMPVGGGGGDEPRAVRRPWREPAPRRRVRRPLAIGAGVVALLLLIVLVATQRGGGRAESGAPTVAAADSATRDAGLDSLLAVASGADGSTARDSAGAGAPTGTVGGAAGGDVRLDSAAPAPAARPTTAPPATTPRATPTTTPTGTPATTPARPTRARTLAERCRSPLSADQRSCLLGHLERTDARLTRVYQDVIANYRRAAGGVREPATVRALRAEQRAWLLERDRVCRDRTEATEGALWGAARVSCFEQMANRRADALAARLPSAQTSAQATPRRRVGTGEFGY